MYLMPKIDVLIMDAKKSVSLPLPSLLVSSLASPFQRRFYFGNLMNNEHLTLPRLCKQIAQTKQILLFAPGCGPRQKFMERLVSLVACLPSSAGTGVMDTNIRILLCFLLFCLQRHLEFTAVDELVIWFHCAEHLVSSEKTQRIVATPGGTKWRTRLREPGCLGAAGQRGGEGGPRERRGGTESLLMMSYTRQGKHIGTTVSRRGR